MKKKDFCILLAAYNGEKFLKKQITSILNQNNVSLDIFISLDKSSDNSLELIRKIKKKNPNIFLISSNKIFGSASFNFINLIKNVNFKNYSYISFSDQDDIWTKNKLNVAKKKIIKLTLDGYASNTLSFNSKKKTLIIKNHKLTEYDFLFEGGGPGHSIVLTRAIAIQIKNKLNIYKFRNIKINYYDWFIYYYVRSINGNWYIDKNYYTHYRQHTFNEIGSNLGIKGIFSRIRVLLKDNLLKESKNYAIITGLHNKENFKLIYQKNFKSILFIIFNFYKFRRNKIEKIYFLIGYLILFFKKS
tara:strand:- start:131 stop:1036 length:906 start_codon:yes stop_codon:yes gene_type:complete